jgi:hypothetical protein
VDEDDLVEIANTLRGSKRYVLQGFKPGSTLSKTCADTEPYNVEVMRQFRDTVAPYVGEARLRI